MSVDSSSAAPVLDVEGTLDRFGGDKDLLAQMARDMFADQILQTLSG